MSLWTWRTSNGTIGGLGLRLGVYLIFLIAATLLQAVVLPILFPYVRPDLVLLLVVMWGLLGGPVQGGIVGALGGLVVDLFSGRFIGMGILTKGLVGVLVGWLEPRFFKDNLIVPVTFSVCATLGEQLLYWLLLSAFGWGPPFDYVLFRIIVPTVLFDAVIAYPAFLLVREIENFLREFQRNP
mgnify:CR=1 FL=1